MEEALDLSFDRLLMMMMMMMTTMMIYIYIYIYMSENFMFLSVTLYISVPVRRTVCKINKPPDRNNVYIITYQRTQDKQH